MYIVKAVSKIDEWKHDYRCETLEEASAWVAKQQAKKKHWGKFESETEYSLEIIDLSQDADYQKEERLSRRKKLGAISGVLIDEISAYVAGFNLEIEATEADIDNLEAAFSKAYEAMEKKRPAKAKKEILKVDPFGVFNQEFKDDVLSIFTKYGV